MIMKNITNRNIREKVYKITKTIVIGNEIFPGSKINEDELSKRIGVSKTPVREALSKLAHDGIVEIKPNRGAFKVKLTKESISEIMMIREALEGLCIRLAVKNMNEKLVRKLRTLLDEFEEEDLSNDLLRYAEVHQKFHALIHESSRSPRLIQMIRSIYDLTHLLRLQYLKDSEKARRSLELHRKLVDAFERRDVDSAVSIHSMALQSAYKFFLDANP
jgi:DNA-binding GntR family transcriptional regulator